MHSTLLLQKPEVIKTIKEKQMVVFTFGHDNNEVENIEQLKKLGVDAIITDR